MEPQEITISGYGLFGKWWSNIYDNRVFFTVKLFRGLAQLASALRSGRRGRGFKSRIPDFGQFLVYICFFVNSFVKMIVVTYNDLFL